MHPHSIRLVIWGLASLVISFAASLAVMNWLWPAADPTKPAFAAPPPLAPVTRSSTVVVPVRIALSAIRDTIERAAPRNFAGKADNPVPQLIQNADFGWTVTRGVLAANGGQNALTVSTPLNGTVKLTGSLSQSASGAVGGLVNNLLGNNAAKQLSNLNIKSLDANAELHGTAAITARPQLTPNWRVAPNLAAQVNLADTNLSTAGLKLNVASQIKPLIDKMVNEQVASMQQRVQANPIIEQTARREWAKICRSIPLQTGITGSSTLWVELRPVKLSAMQPQIDGNNLLLTLAMEAETRITATESRPDCPFPARLDIVPALDAGRVNIGVPIELPFGEVNRLIDAQLKGRTFPDDGKSAVAITVKSARVEPAADRLLISLLVNAQEQKSWFGFGGDATVHVYGRPVLDQQQQVLRLTDIQLAVDSQAAFGLLGTAAQAALPYMQRALAEQAKIDLKPFAANAREKIAAAIAPFRKAEDGVTIDATITGLRLAGIAFDANRLRVIGEADGRTSVMITQLPPL